MIDVNPMQGENPGVILGANPPYDWTFAPIGAGTVSPCSFVRPIECHNRAIFNVYAVSRKDKRDGQHFRMCQEHADTTRRGLVLDPQAAAVDDAALRRFEATPEHQQGLSF